jgi:hypothetical protein
MARKIFPMRRPTRKLHPLQRPPLQPDARLSARIAECRREAERIEADRARRSAERRAAAIASQVNHADWSARDGAWLAAHPERNHFVRRTVAGEFLPLDQRARWVAIRQIAPGVRVRLPLDIHHAQQRRLVELADTEAGAAWIFELAVCVLGAELVLAALEKASPVHPSAGGA